MGLFPDCLEMLVGLRRGLRGLWGPPIPFGGLPGPAGHRGLRGLRASREGQDVAFFAPSILVGSYFPGHLQYRPGQWPPRAQQKTREVGDRVTNNSKGERSPRRGSCPSTWRCSSRSTNFLGLHSSSKRWCE